jgi:hypothetical protein
MTTARGGVAPSDIAGRDAWGDAYSELRRALMAELAEAYAQRIVVNSRIERLITDLEQAAADQAEDRQQSSLARLAHHWERRTGERWNP